MVPLVISPMVSLVANGTIGLPMVPLGEPMVPLALPFVVVSWEVCGGLGCFAVVCGCFAVICGNSMVP